jgi:hypothetical protein
MPPKHFTDGKCIPGKADGNGGNNAMFPDTHVPASPLRLASGVSLWRLCLRGVVGGGAPPTVRTV